MKTLGKAIIMTILLSSLANASDVICGNFRDIYYGLSNNQADIENIVVHLGFSDEIGKGWYDITDYQMERGTYLFFLPQCKIRKQFSQPFGARYVMMQYHIFYSDGRDQWLDVVAYPLSYNNYDKHLFLCKSSQEYHCE